MKTLIVHTELEQYPIQLCSSFDQLPQLVEKTGLKGRRICFVTDDKVSEFYLSQIQKVLEHSFSEMTHFVFPGGESQKCLDTVSKFYDFYIAHQFDRKTVIAALGGGVTGDMAGFSAATYLRGIPFIQIPTSLLAQVDSSVGGKVGVDYKNSKNIIGAFYQPKFVYINIETLKTLPKREFSAGMAEVIKYGLIVSKDFYQWIKESKEKIKAMEEETMTEMIAKCCEWKAKIVAQDEKESGLREILNFGHTIGHAIETLKNFELVHGECVGIGMVAALYLSWKKGYLSQKELEEGKELFAFFHIPVKADGLLAEEVYQQLFLDKKVKNHKIGFVLLNQIGEAFRTTSLSKEEILDAISYVL